MLHHKKIDGLRCVAISLVIIEHFAFGIGKHISAGYYGVDLFFVISGFLVTTILLQPTSLSPLNQYINFIGRRTLRIFPIYYLAIFILWLSNYSVVQQKLIWFLTYTYNYAWKYFELKNNSVSHFWSLAVEEQFYLLWPLIILGLRVKLKIMVAAIITIILVGYCQMIFDIVPSHSKYNEVGLLTRMASLAMGGLTAIFSKQYVHLLTNKKSYCMHNIFFEVSVLILFSATLLINYKLKPVILGLCSCYFVLKAVYSKFCTTSIERFLTNKWVVYIGTISYGIYVYHLPINYYFTKYLFKPYILEWLYAVLGDTNWQIRYSIWIIKFPFLIFFTLSVAHLSYQYIEKPILLFKDKLFKK